ncbi:MAG: CoA pyrophosphatase [Actinobacteria bacterium]|nr:MAG: CoA pyrophosphatase [Actinomycetota bacterium]
MGGMDPQELRDRLRILLNPAPSVALPPRTSPAAVLVPVLGAAPELRVVFTKRTDTLSRHPGEISFPGGLADPGEELAATALREAQEELGLAPADVELVGALPPVHTNVTGILIVPFVGFLWRDPLFTPNAAEIAGVLEFPLATLIKVGRLQEFRYDGRRFETHIYEMDGGLIWGATGRILASFIEAVDGSPAGKPQ